MLEIDREKKQPYDNNYISERKDLTSLLWDRNKNKIKTDKN